MTRLLATIIAAGVCAAFGAIDQAQAEDFTHNHGAQRLQRDHDDEAVAVRLRLPLANGAAQEWRRGASVSLRLSQTDAGEQRGFDLVSYNFADGGAGVETPVGRYGYDNDDRDGRSHHRLVIAAGLSLAVGVIVANLVDDNEALNNLDDV